MSSRQRARHPFRFQTGRTLAALCLLLFVAVGLAQDDLSNAVQLRLEMFVVSERDGQEQYTPSITARAGQVVEYRILAVNHATVPLQAGTVIVTVPIPADTTYLENSAVPRSEDVLLEFRAADSDYMTPPVFVIVDGERSIAQASDYSGVRWTLLQTMQPGEERQFSFRVTVN